MHEMVDLRLAMVQVQLCVEQLFVGVVDLVRLVVRRRTRSDFLFRNFAPVNDSSGLKLEVSPEARFPVSFC